MMIPWVLWACSAWAAGQGYQVTLDGELLSESAVEDHGELLVPLKDVAHCLDAEMKSFPAEGRVELFNRSIGRGEAISEGVRFLFRGIRDSAVERDERGRRIVLSMELTNTTPDRLRFYPELSHVQLHDQFGFSYEGDPLVETQRDFVPLEPGKAVPFRWSFDAATISRGHVVVLRAATDRSKRADERPAVRFALPDRPASSP